MWRRIGSLFDSPFLRRVQWHLKRVSVTHTNPGEGFLIEEGDALIVIAETLGDLEPLHD